MRAAILLSLVSIAHALRVQVSRRSANAAALGIVASGGHAWPANAAVAATTARTIAPASGTLSGGNLPLTIGQGTCLVRPGQASNTVSLGLGCGYRLFDTAQRYGNEEGLGKALQSGIKSGKVSRDELFVTTKVWVDNMGDGAAASVRQSAKDLGVGPIDLVLIHWPGQFIKRGVPENDALNRNLREKTWAALEGLQKEGLVRQLGVSNFSERHLKELLGYASPGSVSVNQFEVHPYNQRRGLVALCESKGILVNSYCPLGGRGNKGQVTDELLKDPKILALAKAQDRTAAQVILRWHLQRGITPIPKASSKAHLAENYDCFGFELSAADMATLDGLNRDQFALFDADVLA